MLTLRRPSISTRDAKPSPRRYLLWVAAGSFVLWAPVLLCAAFLLTTREHLNAREVVKRQRHTGEYYGTALYDTRYDYKLELVKQSEPVVAALGSSRVMQFRGEYFRAPFVNAGGALNDLPQSRWLLRDLPRTATTRLRLVVLGVESWWFDDASIDPLLDSRYVQGGERILLKSTKVADWLLQRKLGPKQLLQLVFAPRPGIGVDAVLRGNGYDRDGSYHYTARLSGKEKPAPEPFVVEIELFEHGPRGTAFARNVVLSETRRAEFSALLTELRARGIQVVTFMPPFAPPLIEKMKELGGYGHLDQLHDWLSAQSEYHYDFRDPHTFGSNVCEFLDGVHGGEIAFARILRAMASDRGNPVAAYVDADRLDYAISRYAGHASAARAEQRRFGPEVDFLRLGCPKNTRPERPREARAAASPAEGGGG